ncbi:hypothetical protein [Chamaesiphon sp. OTE_20_metabat_361]|uniref:hypothetical protein n=1 Tax=Chamaesiphon sp. OTE_20_metabat_361 TaxID=2964689 RepID=UPI00286B7D21|nr:hypothetical protein [Chamaesiphon sp. OTE_20_metabat_361]
MTELLFILVFITFVPFLVAQVMPNRKFLLAYFIAVSATIISILREIVQSMARTVAEGKDLPGHGIGEGLVLILICVFAVSGISGMISKAIFLHFKTRSIVVSKEFKFTVGIIVTMVLTFIIPSSILYGLTYIEQQQKLEKIH